MREILFRGKTPSENQYYDDGYWVEGFYTRFYGNEHRIYTGYAETDCGDYYPDWCNVRAETVGQYTGLTDSNGKKIFEGDIVSAKYGELKKIGFVFYYERGAKFGIRENSGYDNLSLLFDKTIHEWDIKVIGNIHDNPEC
jgi:uncharacterized phage protein (TIGR01671 family)